MTRNNQATTLASVPDIQRTVKRVYDGRLAAKIMKEISNAPAVDVYASHSRSSFSADQNAFAFQQPFFQFGICSLLTFCFRLFFICLLAYVSNMLQFHVFIFPKTLPAQPCFMSSKTSLLYIIQ